LAAYTINMSGFDFRQGQAVFDNSRLYASAENVLARAVEHEFAPPWHPDQRLGWGN
jgi:hypothetical protein